MEEAAKFGVVGVTIWEEFFKWFRSNAGPWIYTFIYLTNTQYMFLARKKEEKMVLFLN